MDLGLRGSRALITGGSRGIGLAIADVLAAEGAAVGLIARDPDGLARAARRLAERGIQVATAAADVTDTLALDRAVGEIAAALGGLDHLVANAGGTVGGGNLTNSSAGDFTATFALNAGHAAELIRAGLVHLRAAGGGSVVIISSITGTRPAPRTAYAAAKAAEIQLAATAAQELAPAGIRVNAVSPGSIMFPGGSAGTSSSSRTRTISPPSRPPSSPWAAWADRRRSPTWSRSCSRRGRRGSPARTSSWTAGSATRAPAASTEPAHRARTRIRSGTRAPT